MLVYKKKPESPFQQHEYSREQHALREHDFLKETDSALDEYIMRGREVLNNIYDQNNTLKVRLFVYFTYISC